MESKKQGNGNYYYFLPIKLLLIEEDLLASEDAMLVSY